jgi:hypothetical protein
MWQTWRLSHPPVCIQPSPLPNIYVSVGTAIPHFSDSYLKRRFWYRHAGMTSCEKFLRFLVTSLLSRSMPAFIPSLAHITAELFVHNFNPSALKLDIYSSAHHLFAM